MNIDNATIEFVQGRYGEFGSNEQRKLQLEEEQEIIIELKEKLKSGEITHEEYLIEYDEQVQGRFKSLNNMEDFKLDNDINIGDIFLVTREKQDPEYPDDRYLCYEIYDKATGKLMANTDRENNLNIYDQKLLDKYPELEAETKKMFLMARVNEETGKIEDTIVVKNKVDYEQENKIQLAKDIKEDKEHTVYNTVDKDNELNYGEPDADEKEAENEEQLLEKANKGKKSIINGKEMDDNNAGKGKVVVAKLIEDPSVRDNIPDATAKTWMVMYENGEMDMFNGRGEKLESIIQITQGDKVIDTVDQRGDDETKIETTFAVKGRENGLVFPVTKENNQTQLNIQDRENDPQIVIPVQMEGYTEVRDNMDYIYAQRIIDEILSKPEYDKLVKKEPEITNRILEMCYTQNDTSLNGIQRNIDYCNRKYEKENDNDHDIPEEHEILTPEEMAWKRINDNAPNNN
ncbi:MAG: hypothetical protein E7311_05680 [Clostridiales bacterium]|nr:hypothetical protein [Clostridiales bacterium]